MEEQKIKDTRTVEQIVDDMDSRMLKAGQEFAELQDSYMVFITQTDIFGHGLPIYTINRHFEEIDDIFDDGTHIIYVNGSYKGDDAIGRMMHDFGCKESKDIYYPELAKGVKHFKEEEGGRKIMCEAVERYADRRGEERRREDRLNTIRNMIQKNYSKEQILDIGFTAEEYAQAEASMLATV